MPPMDDPGRPRDSRDQRQIVATVTDAITEMGLRGRHSNSRSSTAISTDASGGLNVAAMVEPRLAISPISRSRQNAATALATSTGSAIAVIGNARARGVKSPAALRAPGSLPGGQAEAERTDWRS